MERLPFTINDLIQYNFVEDNEYFNLYIQIRTEFIKNHVKRSHYVGVLGAILLQSERQLLLTKTNNKNTWSWGQSNSNSSFSFGNGNQSGNSASNNSTWNCPQNNSNSSFSFGTNNKSDHN
eukprot:312342_1